ncbi:MAG: glycosyltransferase family 4 protein [Patescibacteria group bacterium]|nr:glycosyltransferase family 4 protein [Patescibacteria group bacterium]MDD5294681.1 glycosyltransferase family 4 protein [Patescibacteria group bacterium]MDD5554453.1 glycosyltransferase family 4 protein [Patescibacteria group bacterium]
MKLLILTQKVDIDDDVLGFMHSWIEEFAKHCEKVTVICLQRGRYEFPGNVRVLSLGKDEFLRLGKYFNFIRKLVAILRFYNYIIRERKNYDKVFVHMNPEYVVLGGVFWKLAGKKITLWYAHGYVPFYLKVAERLVNIIFTSTASGCRLKSRKIKIIGQGIDVNKFRTSDFGLRISGSKFKIISIGRISPSKDYATLIKAVEILKNKGIKINVKIIGGPATESDKNYFNKLSQSVKDKNLENEVKFIGPIANKDIVPFLQEADIFVNMGQTGSLDKAMVEAMACQLPVITCNEAMLEVLRDYRRELMYSKKDFKGLAEKIEHIYNLPVEQFQTIGKSLREIVVKNHSLENLVKNIIRAIP